MTLTAITIGFLVISASLVANAHSLKPFNRIAGGEEALPNQFPWQVSISVLVGENLRIDDICGGSLISEKAVVTAAHCLQVNNPGARVTSVEVLFGAINRTPSSDQIRISSRDYLMHESYNGSRSLENDIALIRFPSPVPQSDAIRPIALPENVNEDFTGSAAVLSGWGLLRGSPAVLSPLLRFVRSSVISNSLCEAWYGSSRVFNSTLCTSGQHNGSNVGSCGGDAGGPVSIEMSGRQVLIGITSFGSGGCGNGYPSGAVRVTSYMLWIRRHQN